MQYAINAEIECFVQKRFYSEQLKVLSPRFSLRYFLRFSLWRYFHNTLSESLQLYSSIIGVSNTLKNRTEKVNYTKVRWLNEIDRFYESRGIYPVKSNAILSRLPDSWIISRAWSSKAQGYCDYTRETSRIESIVCARKNLSSNLFPPGGVDKVGLSPSAFP